MKKQSKLSRSIDQYAAAHRVLCYMISLETFWVGSFQRAWNSVGFGALATRRVSRRHHAQSLASPTSASQCGVNKI
jgi:hypothetical protein